MNLLWIILLIVPAVHAQRADTSLTVEGTLDLMVTQGSPAFTLLGREPAAVERPTVINDFSVIAHQATQSQSALPLDVGVEFNPYLLLTGSRALSMKEVRSPEWYKTISFSAGTISDTLAFEKYSSTILGIGVKLSPVSGTFDDRQLDELRANLREMLKQYNAYLERWGEQEQVRAIRDRINELESQEQPDMAEYSELVQEYALLRARLVHHLTLVEQVPAADLDTLTVRLFDLMLGADPASDECMLFEMGIDSLRAYGERILNTKLRRTGFTVDLAGGASWAFARGDADSSSFHMAGGWITAGYEGLWDFANTNLSALALGRYLTDRSRIFDQDNIDVGGRVLLDTESPFSMSVEAVYRWWSRSFEKKSGLALERDGTAWRVVGSATYQVGTSKSISLNFGRTFDDPTGRDLIASLSLNVLFNDAKGIELTPDLLR